MLNMSKNLSSIVLGFVIGFPVGITVMKLYTTYFTKTVYQLPLTEIDFTANHVNSSQSTIQNIMTLQINKDNKSSKYGYHSINQASTPNQIIKSSCPYNFTVFVYPIPESLLSFKLSEEARQNETLHVCHKCILEQFSLEYIIYDYFTQFCGRVHDPEIADFFYIPMIRDAEFRTALHSTHIKHKREPSLIERMLINILEKSNYDLWNKYYGYTDKYWKRYQGADHIIVMPAPVTNFRHESSRRGFFHYMSHLHPPIFLNIEYSLSFVQEYPICATHKNIVMPYPSIDYKFFNYQYFQHDISRDYLIYYSGGLHGDCVYVREAMRHIMNNSTKLQAYNITPPTSVLQNVRENGFRASVFCPIPVGDSPSSKRMYDVMNYGCIPIVISDDLIWAYSDMSGGPLNHSTYAIHLPQVTVQMTVAGLLRRYKDKPHLFGGILPSGVSLYALLQKADTEKADYMNGHYINPLIQVLMRISAEDIKILQEGVLKSAPHSQYYAMNRTMHTLPLKTHTYPNGKAMDTLELLLQQRKYRGIVSISQACQVERHRKGHKYIGSYPCEVNPT